MKKCPTCDKTFEDSMRFCQVDGTSLVEDEPAFDPYATIVAQPIPTEYTAPAEVEAEPEEVEAPVEEVAADAELHYTVGSIPIAEPDDVLDLPSTDPLKTMYVSESEMQAALGNEEPETNIIDVPPAVEEPQPDPPSFIAEESPAPSYTEAAAPPPSPFSMDSVPEEPAPPAYEEAEPAAPVFDEPALPAYEEPASPAFDEAATMIQPAFNSPFDAAHAPVAEWTPPPVPDAAWQNQEIGSNTPFQPPPAGAGGENKTLAIVSLVAGILGMTICCGGLIPSIVAIVTGVMARSKAAQDPQQYGGAGLAMAGLITGVLGLILGIVLIILQIVFGVLSNLG